MPHELIALLPSGGGRGATRWRCFEAASPCSSSFRDAGARDAIENRVSTAQSREACFARRFWVAERGWVK
jgi:hypothetical protein